MSAFKAITSYFTLVDKARKPISLFQEVAEAYDDLQDLKQQISSIDAIVQYCQEIHDSFLNNSTLSHLRNSLSISPMIQQLESIRNEVSAIVAELPGDKLSPAMGVRLLPHRTKINRLLEKSRNQEQHICFMIDLLRSQLILEAIQNRSTSSSFDSEKTQFQNCFPDDKIVDIPKSNHPKSSAISLRRNTSSSASQDFHVAIVDLESHSREMQRCRCKCRLKQNRIKGPVYLQPLFGSFLVDYTMRSKNGVCKCIESQFRSVREPRVNLQYQLPPWLWARECLVRATYSNFSLSFALRPARILNLNDPMWGWIDQYSEDSNQRGNTLLYYPHDRDLHGEGLIEYAITCDAFGAIKVLLAQWQNLLEEQGLPREAGIQAARQLGGGKFTDDEVHLLKEVIRWTKDMPDGEATKVHQAALRDYEMKEALKDEAWAINDIDRAGHAPIHYAVRERNIEALKELIAAGADIDRSDYDGWTPLMFSAKTGHVQSMKLLLKEKCNIEQKSRAGDRAIHLAVSNGRFEAVELLRVAGASASAPGYRGRTPLHYLAECTSTDHNTTEKLACLLLEDRGVSIESRDCNGFTPAMLALRYNNTALLRILVKNKASLKPISFLSRNILHIAAYYSNLELLECLLGMEDQEFLGIDTELCDKEGDTPRKGLEWLIKAPALERGMARCPSFTELEAFERLYHKIRNGNAQHEIQILEETTCALLKQESALAFQLIGDLITQKKEWGPECDIAYYRGILQRINNGDFEGVIRALEDDVSNLNNQLGLSWDGENASASSQSSDNYSEIYSSEDENDFSAYALEFGNQDGQAEMQVPWSMRN